MNIENIRPSAVHSIKVCIYPTNFRKIALQKCKIASVEKLHRLDDTLSVAQARYQSPLLQKATANKTKQGQNTKYTN